MATLEKIRSHGVLLAVIVGLAMLAFILGDFFSSSTSFFSRSQANVAEINGNDIDIITYQGAIEQLTEVYKIETNRNDLSEEIHTQICNQVWNSFLTQYVLEGATKEVGLTVTDDELATLCFGEHPHQLIQGRRAFYDQTGNFNPLVLAQFVSMLDDTPENPQQEAALRQYKTYWLYWEHALRLSYLQEKYNALVAGLVGANKLDAEYAFNARQTTATVQYAVQPFYTVADSLVTVSNSELKNLYNQKKETFKQTPNRTLHYVAFDIKPSAQDYKDAEEWINDIAKEFAETEELQALVNSNSEVSYDGVDYSETTIPALYKDFAFAKGAQEGAVSEISFEDNVYSIARLVKVGYALPDSLNLRYTMIASDAELDSVKAAWKATTEEPELGWMTAQQLPREMVEKLFAAAKGEVVTFPYGTGYQVFMVADRAVATPKVKMAIMQRTVTPSSKTYASIYNEAKQFIVTNNTKDKLLEAAAEKGMTVMPAYNLQANQDQLAGLKSSRPIIRWAFNKDTKIESVSDVFECGDQFIVATLSEVNDSEYRTLEQVQAQLRQEIMRGKKAAIIEKNLAGAATLEEAAQLMGTDIQVAENVSLGAYRFGNAGVEPAVTGAAMRLAVDEVSAPLQGNNGVYVLKCTAKVTDAAEMNAEQEMAQLNMNYMYSLPYMLMQELQNSAEVTDNRAKFF